MKRIFKVLVIVLCVSLVGCTKQKAQEDTFTFSNDYEPVKYTDFIDLGNNVLYFEVNEDLTSQTLADLNENYDGWPSGCTAIANINSNGELIIGRNNDSEISEYPILVSVTTGGKYKTFNVCYCSDGDYTYEELLEIGEMDNIVNYAYVATDVLNEEGLYIENNMRYAGLEDIGNSGSNPGKQRAPTQAIPCLVAQNCATVAEAVEFLKDSYDFYTVSSAKYPWIDGWDAGFLIGDAKGNYGVIEIANNTVTFTPNISVNANFYHNEEFAKYDTCFCGKGRAAFIADEVVDVQTIEDAMKLIEKASWYHEVLDIEYSYIDEDGAHFFDSEDNPSFDYRDELPGSFLVDESGQIILETGYEDDYYEYLYNCVIGDYEKAKEHEDGYNKQQEYYARCTSEFLTDDANFEQVKLAYLDYFGESKDLLERYFAGDYKPLMADGWVLTTGVRTGVNCTKKEMVVEIFERDDLIMKYQFN